MGRNTVLMKIVVVALVIFALTSVAAPIGIASELPSGSARIQDWDKSGDSFSFSDGEVCSGCWYDAPAADFFIADRGVGSIIHVFDSPGIIDMGVIYLDAIGEAPASGYQETVKPIEGHSYVVRSQGKYGKIYIEDIFSPEDYDWISVTEYEFEWVYQPDGTRSFGGGAAILTVSPDTRNVSQGAGTTTFSVGNSGSGTMLWSASVTTGASWLQITSEASGTNTGTIALSYSANSTTSARTGTVTVSAPGATGSPISVNVVQAGQTSTANRPPTVSLVYSPTNPTPDDTIVFTATASDPDGDTLTYQWYLDGAEQTGATAPEVRWSNPPAGTHTVRVVVSDGRGGTDDASVTLTVGSATGTVSHTYGSVAGWYIISVPVRVSVSSGMTIYRWNPGMGAYEIPTVLEPEYGYWALLGANAAASIAGTSPTYNVTIPITSAGWHQVSAAWGYPKSAIQVIKGSETKSWADAVTAGWLRDDIYGYKASDGSYSTPSTMNPWYGYWVNARVSGLSLKLFYASSIPMSTEYTPMEASATSMSFTPDGLPPMPITSSMNGANLVFSCSPNPVTAVHTTYFSVKGVAAHSVTTIKVQIFDLSGQLIYEGEEAGTSLAWHTDNMDSKYLANGVYLYKLSALFNGHWVTSGTKSIVILR